MTQEQKELLLKDLCARLAYRVICEDIYGNILELNGIDKPNTVTFKCSDNTFCVADLDECKPYLFPLSSMTEEQEMEYDATFATIVYEDGRRDSAMTYKSFDWLNKNHFDYRDLIPMGLALDATGLNIY